MYTNFQNQTLIFIPSFREVIYSLVLGQKNLPRSLCSLCRAPTNFAKQLCDTFFPSLAFQTLAKMMAMAMVLMLNTRNLRERSAMMAMVIVRHKELEK
jgi:hypothetical protein